MRGLAPFLTRRKRYQIRYLLAMQIFQKPRIMDFVCFRPLFIHQSHSPARRRLPANQVCSLQFRNAEQRQVPASHGVGAHPQDCGVMSLPLADAVEKGLVIFGEQ
jgi:hypothetical protein